MTNLEITDLMFGLAKLQAKMMGASTEKLDKLHAVRMAEIIANEEVSNEQNR